MAITVLDSVQADPPEDTIETEPLIVAETAPSASAAPVVALAEDDPKSQVAPATDCIEDASSRDREDFAFCIDTTGDKSLAQHLSVPKSPLANLPAKPPPKPLCGMCLVQEAKYKCPRCQLPYCSVACFRPHKENHPPDPPKPVPAAVAQAPLAADPNKVRKRKQPFSVLDDSPELDRLFRKYPRLPSRLKQIHAATLQPRNEQQQQPGPGGLPWNISQAPGNQSKTPKWSHDTGLKRGKKALRKARTDPSDDGDAVREYCELVLYLLAKEKDSEVDVTDLVRQQVVKEDVKLIEQLNETEAKYD